MTRRKAKRRQRRLQQFLVPTNQELLRRALVFYNFRYYKDALRITHSIAKSFIPETEGRPPEELQ